MIRLNRLLPYTFFFLIKASPGCLDSGIASCSHQVRGGESYKTSTVALTELPVFQRLAYCVRRNYTRRNVLRQNVISACQRPSDRLQYFTCLKAIRGSVRLDNRNFFLWKLNTDDCNYLILPVRECVMNSTASRNLGQPRLRSWQWLQFKVPVFPLQQLRRGWW